MFRQSPGPCPICGAAHVACTTDSGPIRIPQLPQRDAGELQAPPITAGEPEVPVEKEFSTATYRGKRR